MSVIDSGNGVDSTPGNGVDCLSGNGADSLSGNGADSDSRFQATRLDVAGKDKAGNTRKDVMWSVSFPGDTENIVKLLCTPVPFVCDLCKNLGVTSEWFVDGQPITLQFTYSQKNSPAVLEDDLNFLAQGMYGNNLIFVKCPFIDMKIDINPFVDMNSSISNLLGVVSWDEFSPMVVVNYMKESFQFVIHYEFKYKNVFNDELPYRDFEGGEIDPVARITSKFIQNPNIAALCLNQCENIHVYGLGNDSDGFADIKMPLRFLIKGNRESRSSVESFVFTYQTKPLNSSSTVIPSDCVTFIASCNPEDYMSNVGILIAEMEAGFQLRWLPSEPPPPIPADLEVHSATNGHSRAEGSNPDLENS